MGKKNFGRTKARLNFGGQVGGSDVWSLGGGGGGWVQPSLIIQSRLGKWWGSLPKLGHRGPQPWLLRHVVEHTIFNLLLMFNVCHLCKQCPNFWDYHTWSIQIVFRRGKWVVFNLVVNVIKIEKIFWSCQNHLD
jgi:hypothetical protein